MIRYDFPVPAVPETHPEWFFASVPIKVLLHNVVGIQLFTLEPFRISCRFSRLHHVMLALLGNKRWHLLEVWISLCGL